jgi:hypothetical protein
MGLSMKSVRLLAALAALAIGVSAASGAAAVTLLNGDFYQSYNVTLPDYPVVDLVLFQGNQGGYGITFGGCCQGAGVGTTTISDPFVHHAPINSNFILGVTSDLPHDAPGQQHLVVFTNNSFASSAQSIAFGTLFPHTNEDALITDITTNLDRAKVGDTVYNQAVSDLYTFGNGDASAGPNGPVGFTSNDTFTAVAFSNGQIIGSGQSFTAPAPPGAPGPEVGLGLLPALAAMMGLALTRRRQLKAGLRRAVAR